jgi:tetratricopeptide (TPR) repeat protein
MTAPVLEVLHPEDETLAAFVDGRANEETREQVIAHIADCAECRDLVLLTSDVVREQGLAATSDAPMNVVPHRRVAARWIVPFAAAAAVAGWIFFIPGGREFVVGYKPEALIGPAESLHVRSTAARISLPVPYKRHIVNRGENEDDLGSKAAVVERLFDNERAMFTNQRTSGLAQLLIATNAKEFDAAVDDLEKAYGQARAEERDAVAMDLAAALIGRGAFSSIPEDHKRAYALADDVWKRTKSPVAAWNRAAALEALGRDKEAIAAWQTYLKLDPNSEWADEARYNLDKLDFLTD